MVFSASGDAVQDWQNCVVIAIATTDLNASKDVYLRVIMTGAPLNTTFTVDVYYLSAWTSTADGTAHFYYPWLAGTCSNSTAFVIAAAKRGEAIYDDTVALASKPTAESAAVCNGMLLKFTFNTSGVNPEILPFGSYPVNIEITLGPS